MKLAWFGGLYETPILIDFDFGKRMSKIIFTVESSFNKI